MSGATLTGREARRIALKAQGLVEAYPATPRQPHVLGLVDRLGLLQIDSVNVLARAHYVPAFSRLGAYDTGLLDRAAWAGERRLFEFWGHEASLLPVETHPLLRWRMAEAERGQGIWAGVARFAAEQPGRIRAVLAEVEARGRLAASDLDDAGRQKGPWWGWSDGKIALECLFWSGRVTVATRRGAFERVYDLPERVLPAAILARPTPSKAEAQRGLLRIAARALGIATGGDLAAYFRLAAEDARPRIAELVEAGDILPVSVEGWSAPAYLWPGAERPARVATRRLLSPFDPLLWERPRTERLFGFRYRLEIYTPAHKREHGYYVLPFLLNDRLVGRFDLKADRRQNRLLVAGAHHEGHSKAGAVAEAAWPELGRLAGWLGLGSVAVAPVGTLAAALAGLGAVAPASLPEGTPTTE